MYGPRRHVAERLSERVIRECARAQNPLRLAAATRAQHLALIECEVTEDDVNRFFDLAGRRLGDDAPG